MCGIFGIITSKNSTFSEYFLNNTLKELALLSESRGKDSSGMAFWNEEQKKISILKGPVAISQLLNHNNYKSLIQKNTNSGNSSKGSLLNYTFTAMGHARLVTNGTQLEDYNNQPVVKNGIIGIHNGIIVNVDELWERNSDLEREYEIDTEVMLALIRKYERKTERITDAVSKAINEVFGTVATALFFNDRDEFILATNNGSLYVLSNFNDILIFASERYILTKLSKKINLQKYIGSFVIKQIKPDTGYSLKLKHFKIEEFSLNTPNNSVPFSKKEKQKDNVFAINIENISGNGQWSALVDLKKIATSAKAQTEEKLLEYNIKSISQLRCCTKCLLPETFPFIIFDEHGVCNICNNYKLKNQSKPIDDLQKLVKPYRSKNGEPDCIVPFSGGRDSTYTLHIVKNVLGLNPIAMTYDWGMVTDLARRNIARVCGKLGIENIIVAANIKMKRANIRKNVTAWLKKPNLGMIPLFMAGDKYFFYYTNQLKKQTGIKLNIWGVNNLENTDFKVGFCGIGLDFDKKRIYSLKMKNQFKLISFYAKNYLKNSAYINSSIIDTIGSFSSRFFFPQEHYYHLFDFMRWDEKEIESVIFNEYNWETAIDTKSTWRIGDGTASFYNYIYYTVAGFSEIDTFRSNQIREGLITREKALELSNEENRPRYETIRWYLDIIGLDYEDTIKTINKIPKLY